MASPASAEDASTKDINLSSFIAFDAKAAAVRSNLDADALRLAQMGYTQDMKRNFSVLSVLGVGFSVTNSWFGISAGLITGINSGGPVLVIYGIILIFLISIGVGVTLSELASALPSAGGQYFWASELAPRRYASFASYLTGWLAWCGAMFTSASIALSMGFATVGCYQLAHPNFEIKPWHVFLAYQVVNIFAFWFNCYGRTLPFISACALYTSLLSFLTILIAVPASAPSHKDANFVFATFINNTGWQSNPIAFIVGLINTNWAFACLDVATHLAEEVAQPEKMVPVAILGTVAIGFLTAWPFGISMFFSIVGDFEKLVHSDTNVPILQLFYGAVGGNRAAAIVLEALIIATGITCLIASHTCRLCWSFSRDRGIPFHATFSKVHPGLEIPLAAHLLSCVVVAIVGCLYLGSYTAFNSMITACIVLLYISYSVPVVCLLIRGRDNIKHGPFWMGKFGLFANIVLLCWTIFTFVMYSFPTVRPVKPHNMNYVSAVYGVIGVIVCVDWFARGRMDYRGHVARLKQAERLIRRSSIDPIPGEDDPSLPSQSDIDSKTLSSTRFADESPYTVPTLPKDRG